MNVFTKIAAEEWNEALHHIGQVGVFMRDCWEQAVSDALPFVTYHHYRYRDSHLVRAAKINGRLTTAPFSDGSDVIPLGETPLDLVKFQADVEAQFGESVRLRINERLAPVSGTDGSAVVAHEYVVDLTTPLLPRVRKTLRHVLQQPIEGVIKHSDADRDIDAAYTLYVRHMRSVRNFAMPKKLFVALIRRCGGELWVWYQDTVPCAAAVFVSSGDEVLYSLSAANALAFAAHAPHHLVYTALEMYRTKGISHASLGATGKGSALEVFKRGWRGEQYRIYELGEHTLGVGRTSRVRGLAGYVPLPLYPLLTTRIGRYLL
jgi:hypothetical protein